MRDASALLQAGGIVPPNAALPAGEPTDAVVARTYAHPALGERRVVRLVAESLVPGADAEASALGFGPPAPGPVVGRQRRRAPGFPGWALLNDPKNARYALEIVQDLKKAQRTAQSKPGHARDALIALGAKLARTAPHFLPSFWEECGRLFLGVGNHTYAAQSFEKAREAERQFSLPVDEAVRAEAFLEFALSGALAAKSLVAYARSLGESKDKPRAYGLFYDLCLRRTLGGVAPFTGMAKELRTLAKAGGLDPAAEERRFLKDALPSPAMQKCAAESWKTWRPSLIALAKAEPATASRLLDLFPTPSSGFDDDFKQAWIDLLTASGALTLLTAPADGPGADAGRAARWVHTLLGWLDDPHAVAVTLIETLAPRLIADAVPVNLVRPESWREEIDPLLLERALALGVPLVTPTEDDTLDLSHWAQGGADAPDLVRIAADARYAPLIARSLERVFGDEDFETAARGKPSLRAARRAWLLEHVDGLVKHGLPDVFDALESLESSTAPAIYAEFPEALARMNAVDVTPVLRATLNAGVFDELGWPALEKAYAELRGTGPKPADVSLSGVYPWLVLYTDRKAVVLGADGVVFAHDLKLPKGADPMGFRWSGGQLLVIYRDDAYQGKGYWSGRPAEVFDVANVYAFGWRARGGQPLPDGRVVEGRRPLSPGDTTVGAAENTFGDGTLVYTVRDEDDDENAQDAATRAGGDAPPPRGPDFRKVDLATGKLGPAATPAFFAAFVADRPDRVLGPVEALSLAPAPPGLTASPLGLRDGLVGQRARTSLPPQPAPGQDEDDLPGPDILEVEGIDGRTWTGFVDGEAPDALIALPGAGAGNGPFLAAVGGRWRSEHALWRRAEAGDAAESWRVAVIDDEDEALPAGTPVLPRLDFWHFFAPRDPAGSAALRTLTDEKARALLDAAVAHAEALAAAEAAARASKARKKSQDDDPQAALPLAAVRDILPELTHPGLIAGVAQQAARAADVVRRVGKLTGAASGAVEAAPVVADPDAFDDEHVHTALGRTLSGQWYASGELSAHIAAVAAAFATPATEAFAVPASDLPWLSWLPNAGALAFLACGPRVATDEEADVRGALPKLLARLADTPWAAAPERFRVATLTFESEKSPAVVLDPEMDPDDYEEDDDLPVAAAWVFSHGGFTWAFQRVSDDTDRPIEVRALTDAPAEVLPPLATSTGSRPLGPTAGADFLRRAAEVARTAPLTRLPDGLGAHIAGVTGLSASEATLVYAGVPVLHRYKNDAIGKPLREALGLELEEARVGLEGVDDLKPEGLFEVFARAVGPEPAGLSAPLDPPGESVADRFASSFREVFGPRIPLPEELVAAVGKVSALPMDTRTFLYAVAAPENATIFTHDGKYALDAYGDVERTDDGRDVPPCFDGEAAISLAAYLMFAVPGLPAGDPFRRSLPTLLAAARGRLENPDLLVEIGCWYPENKKVEKAQKAWFESLGGTQWAPLPRRARRGQTEEPNPPERGRDTGLLVVYCDEDGSPNAAWRPAQARSAADLETVQRTHVLFGEDDTNAFVQAVAFLRSEAAQALADRAAHSPLPAGRWENDPRATAPETVTAAAAALGLDPDAAALYLQILALPQPTQRSVLQWNDWKPAAYKKAAATLTEKGLVVEGKRPRAGREHFLPGGWDELAAPDLPLETWKAPLYGLTRGENGKLRAPLGQVLVAECPGDLFARAWARVAAGDRPALEVIKTGRAAKADAKTPRAGKKAAP